MPAIAAIAGALIGMAGCDAGTPATGSQAVVPADHRDKQNARAEQLRAGLKNRPSSRAFVRR